MVVKRLDGHRYIKLYHHDVLGEVVELYYRVPYRDCIGRLRVKHVPMALEIFGKYDSPEETISSLESRAEERGKRRAYGRALWRSFSEYS